MVILLAGFGVLYSFFGLKEYISVATKISKLTAEQQKKAQDIFYYAGGTNGYSGIIAAVITKGRPGVWVWGRKGIKFFEVDEFTVYMLFAVCNEDNYKLMDERKSFSPKNIISPDLSDWKNLVKIGQYVGLTKAVAENGGNIGKVREIKAYDWYLFFQSNIKAQCLKK